MAEANVGGFKPATPRIPVPPLETAKPPQGFSGGMTEAQVKEFEKKIRAEYEGNGEKEAAPTKTDQERMDRADLHIKWLAKELQDLLNSREMAGPLRRSAAKHMQQFGGVISQWTPIKVIKDILQTARETANLPPAKQDRTLDQQKTLK